MPFDSRYLTALTGLALSIAISLAAWIAFDTLLLFLLIPFVPWLFWRSRRPSKPPVTRCPVCGFETRDPAFAYCPRDGHRLKDSL